VSGPTWERRRKLGQTPPAVWITGNSSGFFKRDLDLDNAKRVEKREVSSAA
jgi:hypothetical protein